ncbi:ArfGap-domain-containing protein [Colletotrichum falcatum]|nr:ArfGap-domain-containing protein [Colletotrichum falcatum]
MGLMECKPSSSPVPSYRDRVESSRISVHMNNTNVGIQLGVFLCMRCAAIHRKLGTHVSKVKSLSMDSWSNEQVEVCPNSFV